MDKGASYKTVIREATAELVEKKSRFIAAVRPVATEQDAIDFINAKKSEHYNATHNVYAYVISRNNTARYSDDGEPNGTAGVPVLEVIKKEGLCDVVVVVTRYFGGTLLGAGGLIRAYGKSAKLGIDESGITERVYCHETSLNFGYDLLGKLRYLVENGSYILKDIQYNEAVTMLVSIPYGHLETFQKEVTELTNGLVSVQVTGENYIDRNVIPNTE